MSVYSLTIVTARKDVMEHILKEVRKEHGLRPDCLTEDETGTALTAEYESWKGSPDDTILRILDSCDEYFFASQDNDLEIYVDDSKSPPEWSECWTVTQSGDNPPYITYIGEPRPNIVQPHV